MIIFKTLRWKNFLSTGTSWCEIALDNNKSTLIVGHNGATRVRLQVIQHPALARVCGLVKIADIARDGVVIGRGRRVIDRQQATTGTEGETALLALHVHLSDKQIVHFELSVTRSHQ